MRYRSLLPVMLLVAACSSGNQTTPTPAPTLVPGASTASAALAESPRHAEWVTVRTGPNDSVRAWIVYPERRTKAPVVVVIHHAVNYPDAGAVVSYYGTTPVDYGAHRAPVLGLYGENDERVNSTIARADSASKALGFVYEPHRFTGAGHGFLRNQEGQNGANLTASQQAWPMTVAWFRRHLGS